MRQRGLSIAILAAVAFIYAGIVTPGWTQFGAMVPSGSNATSAAYTNIETAGPGHTGSGSVVHQTSPALVTPDLGTPSAINLANGTGLPPSGTSGTAATLSADQTFTGAQTFNTVYGQKGNGGTDVSGTTYTFVAADCGKLVVFTSASAVTATIPQSIVPASPGVCPIGVLQSAAGKVAVNGSAVTPATLVSDESFTSTSGTAGNQIGLTLMTIGGTAKAFFSGKGS